MNSTDADNIKYYLVREYKQVQLKINVANQEITSHENRIKEQREFLVKLHAHALALLNAAIDYGFNPEVDEL